jgi:hypothetical protein
MNAGLMFRPQEIPGHFPHSLRSMALDSEWLYVAPARDPRLP